MARSKITKASEKIGETVEDAKKRLNAETENR